MKCKELEKYGDRIENVKTNLKLLRTVNELKQQDVADMLGISISAYSYFESGKRVPKRLATLVRLAQVYNVDWEELLKDPKERFM